MVATYSNDTDKTPIFRLLRPRAGHHSGIFRDSYIVELSQHSILDLSSLCHIEEDEEAMKRNIVAPVFSQLLSQLIDIHEQLTLPDHTYAIKTFDTPDLNPPSISLRKYIDRIIRYAPCPLQVFIAALVYIDRLHTSTVIPYACFRLSSLNVHRILITSILISAKFFDDNSRLYNNRYFATLGGIAVNETNSLEVEFLKLLNFQLCISDSTYESYKLRIEKYSAIMNRQKLRVQMDKLKSIQLQIVQQEEQEHNGQSHYIAPASQSQTVVSQPSPTQSQSQTLTQSHSSPSQVVCSNASHIVNVNDIDKSIMIEGIANQSSTKSTRKCVPLVKARRSYSLPKIHISEYCGSKALIPNNPLSLLNVKVS